MQLLNLPNSILLQIAHNLTSHDIISLLSTHSTLLHPLLTPSLLSAIAAEGPPTTILSWACKHGHTPYVHKSLLSNTPTNQKDSQGLTPLHHASIHNHPHIIHLLLSFSASPNETDTLGNTPLHHAAPSGYTTATKHLLEAGATVDAENNIGDTPLLYAGSVGVIKALIQHGANVDFRGGNRAYTRLSIAVVRGDVAAVLALLEGGADPNVVLTGAGTALHLALEMYRAEMETGGVIREPGNRYLRMVVGLMGYGAGMAVVDGEGNTPLEVAGLFWRDEIERRVLARGEVRDFVGEYEATELNAAIVAGGEAWGVALFGKGVRGGGNGTVGDVEAEKGSGWFSWLW